MATVVNKFPDQRAAALGQGLATLTQQIAEQRKQKKKEQSFTDLQSAIKAAPNIRAANEAVLNADPSILSDPDLGPQIPLLIQSKFPAEESTFGVLLEPKEEGGIPEHIPFQSEDLATDYLSQVTQATGRKGRIITPEIFGFVNTFVDQQREAFEARSEDRKRQQEGSESGLIERMKLISQAFPDLSGGDVLSAALSKNKITVQPDNTVVIANEITGETVSGKVGDISLLRKTNMIEEQPDKGEPEGGEISSEEEIDEIPAQSMPYIGGLPLSDADWMAPITKIPRDPGMAPTVRSKIEDDIEQVDNALVQAQNVMSSVFENTTGGFNAFQRGASGVAGFFGVGEWWNTFTESTEEVEAESIISNFVREATRALIISERGGTVEQQTISNVQMPSAKAWFSDPEREAKKFLKIVQLLEQKRANKYASLRGIDPPIIPLRRLGTKGDPSEIPSDVPIEDFLRAVPPGTWFVNPATGNLAVTE